MAILFSRAWASAPPLPGKTLPKPSRRQGLSFSASPRGLQGHFRTFRRAQISGLRQIFSIFNENYWAFSKLSQKPLRPHMGCNGSPRPFQTNREAASGLQQLARTLASLSKLRIPIVLQDQKLFFSAACSSTLPTPPCETKNLPCYSRFMCSSLSTVETSAACCGKPPTAPAESRGLNISGVRQHATHASMQCQKSGLIGAACAERAVSGRERHAPSQASCLLCSLFQNFSSSGASKSMFRQNNARMTGK